MKNEIAALKKEIQLLVDTFRHLHAGFGSDTCRQCGLDIRHPIHREKKPQDSTNECSKQRRDDAGQI